MARLIGSGYVIRSRGGRAKNGLGCEAAINNHKRWAVRRWRWTSVNQTDEFIKSDASPSAERLDDAKFHCTKKNPIDKQAWIKYIQWWKSIRSLWPEYPWRGGWSVFMNNESKETDFVSVGLWHHKGALWLQKHPRCITLQRYCREERGDVLLI